MTIVPNLSDEAALRQAFAHFPAGLAALAAQVDGADQVLLVASFSVGISLSPPLVSFAVQRSSSTWPLLRQAPVIGVSILASGQDHLCRQLSSKDKSVRWAGVDIERGDTGSVLIGHAALTFECAIHAEYPAGDHEVVLMEVKSFRATTEQEPLVFHGSRFRSLEAMA
ncbi:oxidoreductase [Duganella sp. FT80W]|uniref:Oxidoreductase n=1 Tax=Duganella guangzhouensis TaxID=2666084 RepID=A0A6I2KTX6_9BURK|nr:flavin reductase family protein [Duganella guangzhouensis]MRW88507.1 oxidoreductase [Duganella guangzhouensis]